MSVPQDSVRVPARLWHLVAGDLRPVRALRRPAVRALAVVPLAAVLLVAAPAMFSWRFDLPALGGLLAWGASVAQAVVGVALIALALREAVPGRALSAYVTGGATGGAVTLLVVVTVTTATVTHVRPPAPIRIGGICFLGSFSSGVPVVAVAGLLAATAFPVRPVLVGTLYGLGAGLMADAGWRLFCEFSGPEHVFPFHLGAIAANIVLGIAWSVLLARSREYIDP